MSELQDTRHPEGKMSYCRHCGNEIPKDHPSPYYCSQECQRAWQGKTIGVIQLDDGVKFHSQGELF